MRFKRSILLIIALGIAQPIAAHLLPDGLAVGFAILSVALILSFALWQLRVARAVQAGESEKLRTDSFEFGANRQQGSLWVGGRMGADSRSVWFSPSWFERLLRREPVTIDWLQVGSVDCVECMPSLTGGLATCVQLTLVDGTTEWFRVWRAEERAQLLRGFVISHGVVDGEAPQA